MCRTARQLTGLVLVAAGVAWAGCGAGAGKSDETRGADPGRGPWFRDATTESGLAFRHVNGMRGQFYYPEIIVPGVALFDYDNGRRSRSVRGAKRSARRGGQAADTPCHEDRLFRNDRVPF